MSEERGEAAMSPTPRFDFAGKETRMLSLLVSRLRFRRNGLCLAAAAFTAGALAGSGAQAADLLVRKSPPPLIVTQPFTWTGFYIGGQIGYAWGSDRTTEFFTQTGAPTGLTWAYSPDGVVGGVHAGFNYQFSSFVVGLEGDIEAANIHGGFVDPGGAGTTHVDVQGSVRGRLGYAFDRFMLYGTGGVAIANLKNRYTNPVGPLVENVTNTRTGWTVGGGLEYAFTNAITARVEYRYSDFGNYRHASTIAFPGILTGEQEPSFHTVRLGVSYKF